MTRRRTFAALLAAPVMAAGLVVAPLATSAQAASWETMVKIHGAQVQACRASAQGGEAWRIRVRLINGSGHAHVAGASAQRNGSVVDEIKFSAGPGRSTPAKSVLLRRSTSDEVGIGLGELTGEGLGSLFSAGEIRRC